MRIIEVCRGDDRYPVGLGDVEDAPGRLRVWGSLPQAPGVAVVGTRGATSYGLEVAEGYGRDVAEAGWVLVSGLARGIDAAAHRGTVRAGGLGVAVLGSGLGRLYPAENRPLAERLVELGGGVVSEYADETPPEPWRFPHRNRIVAALAQVVVVVESAVRGGALITARLAAEMGRPVLATPGDVDRDTSVGCNLLIRDGAIPVLDGEDLVEAVGLLLAVAGERHLPVGRAG